MASTEPSVPPRPAPRFRGSVQPRRFRGNVLAPLALAALLGGCGLVPEPAPDYLVDSGYRVAIDYVYWLDAHRIIFQGSRPDKPLPPPYRTAINIWDTRTGKIEEYKRVTGRTQLCYADGWISYLPDRTRVPFSEGTRRLHWGGPMGEEEWLNPESKPGHRLHWNRYSCRFQHLKVDDSGLVRAHVLRIGDGRLLLSGSMDSREDTIHWLADDGTSRRELDFTTRLSPFYFDHLGAYFLLPGGVGNPNMQAEWKRRNCLQYGLLRVADNDASIERGCIPWVDLHTLGWVRIAPVNGGFFILGRPYDRAKAQVGGYLVFGATAHRLFSGHLSSRVKVSGDGCKIAVWPRTRSTNKRTLQFIDVCKLKEELKYESKDHNA